MNVYYLSLKPDIPSNDYWSFGFLNDFIQGDMWQPPNWQDLTVREVSELPKTDRAIVVLPGEYHGDLIQEINDELSNIDNVVFFLMADEEGKFPIEKIHHPSIHIWVQFPHPERHDSYHKLGSGYPPVSQDILPSLYPEKSTDAFFSGQITHTRRQELRKYMASMPGVDFYPTKGFGQGLKPEEYYRRMTSAIASPAPAGAIVPDSFRAYEALESMSLLIADEKDPFGKIYAYWEWIFDGHVPFILLQDYQSLSAYIQIAKDNYPYNIHEQTVWWIKKKREFAYKVLEQLHA